VTSEARTAKVLAAVGAERVRQRVRWGENDWPDGTGTATDHAALIDARDDYARTFNEGSGSWRAILAEEVAEAFAESAPESLRAELVQVAAVAVQWIEAIDRRGAR